VGKRKFKKCRLYLFVRKGRGKQKVGVGLY
jgi:hypothetical protein